MDSSKTSTGNPQTQNKPTETSKHESAYEGFGTNDSTASGGFGRNAGGSSFSRANQMGTADPGSAGNDDDTNTPGLKTGQSTPGYRRDGEDGQDVNSQFRGQNLKISKNDDEPEI